MSAVSPPHPRPAASAAEARRRWQGNWAPEINSTRAQQWPWGKKATQRFSRPRISSKLLISVWGPVSRLKPLFSVRLPATSHQRTVTFRTLCVCVSKSAIPFHFMRPLNTAAASTCCRTPGERLCHLEGYPIALEMSPRRWKFGILWLGVAFSARGAFEAPKVWLSSYQGPGTRFNTSCGKWYSALLAHAVCSYRIQVLLTPLWQSDFESASWLEGKSIGGGALLAEQVNHWRVA